MSAVDIRACVEELQQLIGGKVDKIYHNPPDEIRIRIRKFVRSGKSEDAGNVTSGRYDLIIEAGKRIHLTKFPKEAPRFPSSFAMLLRKHLEGGRITKIYQHDFDRIVFIHIERETEKVIIAEFFRKGNVILADSDLKILMPLKFMFKPGEIYKLPKPQINPFELKAEDLEAIDDDREVVKVLATRLSVGGQYAEEICLRAGIDKTKNFKSLQKEEIDSIIEAVKSIFEPISRGEFVSHVVMEDGDYVDVLPVELKSYEDYDKKYFESFNEALDEYYSVKIIQEAEKEEKESKILAKIKKRLEDQLEAKEKFERDMEYYKRVGDFIYENYIKFDKIIETFISARKKMSWDEIRNAVKENQKLSELVRKINPEKNTITVRVEDFDIEIDLSKTVPQIADFYYGKAKKIRQKYEGVLKAIKKTEEELKNVESKEALKFVRSLKLVRKREWYERFRWFFTSENFLVIGGRNAKMNEEIVSKYLEKNDLFFHTQVPGAPVTVLKNGVNAGEKSIFEAAQFAATYSSLWKDGKYSGEIYFVSPEQVKRSARAGEYLARGSFYIEGKRNYLDIPVSCAVGVDLKNLRVFGGPTSAVEKYCDYFVELEIGEKTQNELSVEIASVLVNEAKEDERHLVRSISTPDEIMKFLPPGKSRIKHA
jgi:predicted ribosome quality control (RQC) complex YloA/Tae2 family protein